MSEFARMMAMEGVKPLHAPQGQPAKGRSQGRPATEPPQAPALRTPVPEAPAYAWATGERARTALSAALERLEAERRDGRTGWATGIRQDGSSTVLQARSGAAALISAADRLDLRLMVVGGHGWTFVLHPALGVATLDEDPTEEPA